MDQNKKLRVAVIGVGHLGKFHAQKYAALPQVELVGVVDTDEQKARALAEQYHTQAYTDFRQMIGRIDAASLAVPTALHHALAPDLLQAGIHLLIEKPITSCCEDADRLLALAAEKKLVLQVGHIERFNPAVIRMGELLDRPFLFEAQRLSPFNIRGTDVDVVLDLMIHDLDIILHAVQSEIRAVEAVGCSAVTDKIDMADARLVFANNVVAHLTAGRFSDKSARMIRVFQAASCLSVDCTKREISVTRLGEVAQGQPRESAIQVENFSFANSDPLAEEILSFVTAVSQGTEPVVTGRDGRDALAAAHLISERIMKGSDYPKPSRA